MPYSGKKWCVGDVVPENHLKTVLLLIGHGGCMIYKGLQL